MKWTLFVFLFLFSSHIYANGSWSAGESASGRTYAMGSSFTEEQCITKMEKSFSTVWPSGHNEVTVSRMKWEMPRTYCWYSARNYSYHSGEGDFCEAGQMPVYPATKCEVVPPTCTEEEILDVENNVCVPISKCPKADTFHKKLSSGSEGLTGSTCVSNNCVIKIKHTLTTSPGSDTQRVYYNSFYTGQSCTFDSANQEIKPEDHVWDESPVINPDDPNLVPTPDDPDLPPIGSDPSPTDPTPTPDAPKPNPTPTPTPDNPNLSEAENDLVGGISVTNQYLENIDDNIDRLRTANDANAKEALKYQQHILGELQNGTGSGGGGSGGDGEGEGGCDPEKSTCESDLNFGKPEVTNPFEDILSAEDIVAINQKTDDVKGLINQKINSFKSLVSTPNYGVGGEVEGVVVEANHYGKSIKMEQNFLSRSSGDFSTIIILICGIIAFGVVARR